VGKVHLPTFLQQKLEPKKGRVIEIGKDVVKSRWEPGLPSESISDEELSEMVAPHPLDLSSGRTIGTHNGSNFFTIGQRKGINIGGHREPLFVIGTDPERNLLYVGEGESHQGLYRKGLFISSDEVHWIRRDLKMSEGNCRDYLVRIRYRQPLQKARLFMKKDGLYIIFHKLQRGIAPGQFAAWYDGDELMGSGVINS
jgi:tRNA-specific 2-thiouridylase